MRYLLLVIAFTFTFTSVARAEDRRFGFGASAMRAPNVGISVVTGITEHHALHLRAARYLPLLSPSDDANRSGRIYGASASWVLYANRVLDGASLELGAFVRDTRDFGWTDERARRTSEAVGVHALAGYTIALREGVFIAFALGVSKRLERGEDSDGATAKPLLVAPLAIDGYFRIGWAIDA